MSNARGVGTVSRHAIPFSPVRFAQSKTKNIVVKKDTDTNTLRTRDKIPKPLCGCRLNMSLN